MFRQISCLLQLVGKVPYISTRVLLWSFIDLMSHNNIIKKETNQNNTKWLRKSNIVHYCLQSSPYLLSLLWLTVPRFVYNNKKPLSLRRWCNPGYPRYKEFARNSDDPREVGRHQSVVANQKIRSGRITHRDRWNTSAGRWQRTRARSHRLKVSDNFFFLIFHITWYISYNVKLVETHMHRCCSFLSQRLDFYFKIYKSMHSIIS